MLKNCNQERCKNKNMNCRSLYTVANKSITYRPVIPEHRIGEEDITYYHITILLGCTQIFSYRSIIKYGMIKCSNTFNINSLCLDISDFKMHKS